MRKREENAQLDMAAVERQMRASGVLRLYEARLDMDFRPVVIAPDPELAHKAAVSYATRRLAQLLITGNRLTPRLLVSESDLWHAEQSVRSGEVYEPLVVSAEAPLDGWPMWLLEWQDRALQPIHRDPASRARVETPLPAVTKPILWQEE